MDLQGVSKWARESWDFVNLYSRSRGINRFEALILALDLLRTRKVVEERGVPVPEMTEFRRWIQRSEKLGMDTLKEALNRNPHPDLQRAYDWSFEVNEGVERICRGVVPFPSAPEVLAQIKDQADTMVISHAPEKQIQKEWEQQGLKQYVPVVGGQEKGPKGEQLQKAVQGYYPSHKVLMIGDSPGDFQAAQEKGVLFYPILPGREEASWQALKEEGLARFFSGGFQGDYQAKLLEAFFQALPVNPPW